MSRGVGARSQSWQRADHNGIPHSSALHAQRGFIAAEAMALKVVKRMLVEEYNYVYNLAHFEDSSFITLLYNALGSKDT